MERSESKFGLNTISRVWGAFIGHLNRIYVPRLPDRFIKFTPEHGDRFFSSKGAFESELRAELRELVLNGEGMHSSAETRQDHRVLLSLLGISQRRVDYSAVQNGVQQRDLVARRLISSVSFPDNSQ